MLLRHLINLFSCQRAAVLDLTAQHSGRMKHKNGIVTLCLLRKIIDWSVAAFKLMQEQNYIYSNCGG